MTNVFDGTINKALVALLVGVVVLILAHFGFSTDANMQTALTTVVTALFVYLVPNK